MAAIGGSEPQRDLTLTVSLADKVSGTSSISNPSDLARNGCSWHGPGFPPTPEFTMLATNV